MKENFLTKSLALMLMQSGISYDEAFAVLEEFKNDTIVVLSSLLDTAKRFPSSMILGVTRSHKIMREMKDSSN